MRLFVAVELSAELRHVLAQLEETLESCGSLRFVKPDNVHLTLKFLGEVRDEKLQQVKEALATVKMSEVKLSTTKIGLFSGVFWLGVKLNSELAQLQQAVQRAVLPFALRDPRSYKPHLTIARFLSLTLDERAIVTGVLKAKKIDVSWKVDSFTLYRSTLTPEGPVYEVLARFPR